MAKDVVVTWTTQDQVVPNADKADHFVIGIGTTEASEPLTARSHTFSAVEPGAWQGWVSCVDAAGNELATPLLFSVTVPNDATAPIPVTVEASIP